MRNHSCFEVCMVSTVITADVFAVFEIKAWNKFEIWQKNATVMYKAKGFNIIDWLA